MSRSNTCDHRVGPGESGSIISPRPITRMTEGQGRSQAPGSGTRTGPEDSDRARVGCKAVRGCAPDARARRGDVRARSCLGRWGPRRSGHGSTEIESIPKRSCGLQPGDLPAPGGGGADLDADLGQLCLRVGRSTPPPQGWHGTSARCAPPPPHTHAEHLTSRLS